MKKNSLSKSTIKKRISNTIIRWGFLGATVVWVSYLVINGSNENRQLVNKGVCTKAYVYKKKHVGAKGDINTYYQFMKDDNYYYGISYNDNAQVGDTIIIVYLVSNPNINRSNDKLNKKCPCDDLRSAEAPASVVLKLD